MLGDSDDDDDENTHHIMFVSSGTSIGQRLSRLGSIFKLG